jgi:hypothetical protein
MDSENQNIKEPHKINYILLLGKTKTIHCLLSKIQNQRPKISAYNLSSVRQNTSLYNEIQRLKFWLNFIIITLMIIIS